MTERNSSLFQIYTITDFFRFYKKNMKKKILFFDHISVS